MYHFQKLQEDIILTKLNITKYNYSLDDEVQDFGCQDAYLEIPANAKQINIYNKKIIVNNEYLLEADPKEIERIKE